MKKAISVVLICLMIAAVSVYAGNASKANSLKSKAGVENPDKDPKAKESKDKSCCKDDKSACKEGKAGCSDKKDGKSCCSDKKDGKACCTDKKDGQSGCSDKKEGKSCGSKTETGSASGAAGDGSASAEKSNCSRTKCM